jgi:hypothetical protein
MSTTEDTPTGGPDSPISVRPPASLPALERLGRIEGWAEDVDRRLVSVERKIDAQAIVQQHMATELVAVRQTGESHGRHLKSIDVSIGVLARDLGVRAKQDSVHEVQLAAIWRLLTLRRLLVGSLGAGGALAITTAALVLSELVLRKLGVKH